ncbi:hypothetical protein V6R21_30430 [Limibacter armeniacum]|uniref:hypothetical protein n=1 Tax=Limibacter armeniacum TaxID=466084 RepID=UPI002FE520EF
MTKLKLLFTLLLALMAIKSKAQDEIHNITNVPIDIPGRDRLVGFVDFKAKAFCGGEPRIKMAVTRVVIEGVWINDSYYDEDDIDGFTFPMEATSGNLYLRGDLSYDIRQTPIQEGSITVGLKGFLDWILIKEGTAPHEMSCSEWQTYANKYLLNFSHRLEVFKEECLSRSGSNACLLSELKDAIKKLESSDSYLEKLKDDFRNATTSSQLESIIQKIDSYNWSKSAPAFSHAPADLAKELKEEVQYKLNGLLEEEKDKQQSTSLDMAAGSTVAFKSEKKESTKTDSKNTAAKPKEKKKQSSPTTTLDYAYNLKAKGDMAMKRGDYKSAAEYYKNAQKLGYPMPKELIESATAAHIGTSLNTFFDGLPDPSDSKASVYLGYESDNYSNTYLLGASTRGIWGKAFTINPDFALFYSQYQEVEKGLNQELVDFNTYGLSFDLGAGLNIPLNAAAVSFGASLGTRLDFGPETLLLYGNGYWIDFSLGKLMLGVKFQNYRQYQSDDGEEAEEDYLHIDDGTGVIKRLQFRIGLNTF